MPRRSPFVIQLTETERLLVEQHLEICDDCAEDVPVLEAGTTPPPAFLAWHNLQSVRQLDELSHWSPQENGAAHVPDSLLRLNPNTRDSNPRFHRGSA